VPVDYTLTLSQVLPGRGNSSRSGGSNKLHSNSKRGKALVAFGPESVIFLGLRVLCMKKPPIILLADDDKNDVLLLERAFQRAKVEVRFMVVGDGQEAIDYLSGTGKFGDRASYPWPALVLLDLKMPMVDGFDVLEWWRGREHAHASAGELPIVVMSSSNQESDINRAMGLGAAGYQVKSGDLQNVFAFAKDLREKWLQLAKKEDDNAWLDQRLR
jgi:CheY-like chemotaxis protein